MWPFKKRKPFNWARKKYTIEFIEEKIGKKLTYPNQKVEGSIYDEKYKELRGFGCSDIWDDNHIWSHRDCWGNQYDQYKNCNFYPIVEKYNKEHKIKEGTETDFVKVDFFLDILEKLKNEEEKL